MNLIRDQETSIILRLGDGSVAKYYPSAYISVVSFIFVRLERELRVGVFKSSSRQGTANHRLYWDKAYTLIHRLEH